MDPGELHLELFPSIQGEPLLPNMECVAALDSKLSEFLQLYVFARQVFAYPIARRAGIAESLAHGRDTTAVP